MRTIMRNFKSIFKFSFAITMISFNAYSDISICHVSNNKRFGFMDKNMVNDRVNGLNMAYEEYLKSLNFTNAYYDNMKRPSLYYTTFKKRTDKTIHHAIDHIVHSKHFKTCGLVPIPQPTEYLPNETYPSDHVHITAKLVVL